MSLSKENYDRARRSASSTLSALQADTLDLERTHPRLLEQMVWDLQMIQAAIQMEINARFDRTTDFGT